MARLGRPAPFFLGALFVWGLGTCRAESPAVLPALIAEAHAKTLCARREWLLLLHMRRRWWGKLQSDIDDPAFFLSPQGRTDPAAEMDATLAALVSTTTVKGDEEPPACRYPARASWLKEHLSSGSGIPEVSCPRLENWKSQMNPDSLSLVFASYYMNNPSSMYGHTFLRLNQKKHLPDNQLLDYVVNYAADVTTKNGVLFAVYGLTGGYRGRFSTLPYYMKVQQYSNMESRDLWEYTLTLSSGEISSIMNHLWELGHTSMAYYFLNKNCSYQLLPLLEVGDPSLHLSDRFWVKTIPADTLRAVLAQPGLVSGVDLRPSHVRKMLDRRSRLSDSEARLAERLATSREDPRTIQEFVALPADRQAMVLDSAYDYFRYKVGFNRDQPSEVQEQDQRLLVARSQIQGAPSPPFSFPLAVPPDQAHKSARIGSGVGLSSRSLFQEVSIRPAMQDLEADPAGFVPGSQLEMFDLRLRFDDKRQKGYLEDFTLVNLESLSPWDRWVHSPSWKVNTGLSVARDLDRDPESSLYYGLNLGSGFTAQSHLWRRELMYGLAEADTGVGSVFNRGYRLGGGGTAGVLVEAARFWRIHLESTFLHYPVGDVGSTTKLRLVQAFTLTRNVEVRSTLERQNNYRETLLTLNLYY